MQEVREFADVSIGTDQVDDGGTHVEGWREREAGDQVFWPPPPVPVDYDD